jgi:hypothetical protein
MSAEFFGSTRKDDASFRIPPINREKFRACVCIQRAAGCGVQPANCTRRMHKNGISFNRDYSTQSRLRTRNAVTRTLNGHPSIYMAQGAECDRRTARGGCAKTGFHSIEVTQPNLDWRRETTAPRVGRVQLRPSPRLPWISSPKEWICVEPPPAGWFDMSDKLPNVWKSKKKSLATAWN